MKRLKVGVIGCGVMGGFHLRQYKNIPEVEIVGVSDIDQTRAPQDVRFFNDYTELLKLVDAVSITTPTITHFEIAVAALGSQCHVLVEKPIALEVNQAEKLIRRAKAKRLVLAVGHIERFNPVYMALAKDLRKRIPDIIDIKRFSPFPERITDASCVTDMMIHDIDLARHLANEKIKCLKATGKQVKTDKLDRAVAVLVFENGVVANIEANRVHNEKIRKITVVSGKSIYEADLLNRTVRKSVARRSKTLKVDKFDQLNCELRDFISAAAGKKRPAVTGEDGLAALDIASKIEETAIRT